MINASFLTGMCYRGEARNGNSITLSHILSLFLPDAPSFGKHTNLLLLFRSYVRLIDFSVDDLPSSFAPRSKLGIWKKSLCSFAAVLARGHLSLPGLMLGRGAKSGESSQSAKWPLKPLLLLLLFLVP